MLRKVEGVVDPRETEDGDGAKVRRAIGSPQLSYLDPFLLLDDFSIREPAGFPDHPHRGFEIITYVLEGEVHHADSAGNREIVYPGGLQRVLAGAGVVHSEFPGPNGGRGLQLWVNLQRAEKGLPASYQILAPEQVPTVTDGGVQLRCLAGDGTQVNFQTPFLYWDVTIPAGEAWCRHIPEGWTLFTYGIAGRGHYGDLGQTGKAGQLLIWDASGDLAVKAEDGELRFVVAAAKPINEPIRRWGPYVD